MGILIMILLGAFVFGLILTLLHWGLYPSVNTEFGRINNENYGLNFPKDHYFKGQRITSVVYKQ